MAACIEDSGDNCEFSYSRGQENTVTVGTDVPPGDFCSVKSEISLFNVTLSLYMNLFSKVVCNILNDFSDFLLKLTT